MFSFSEFWGFHHTSKMLIKNGGRMETQSVMLCCCFAGPSLCSEEVEKGLCFLGLLMMKNLVKPQSAGVINTLRQAQLRCIMVTGERFIFNLFSYSY